MWGGVSIHGLYPSDGPVFRDDLLESSAFKVQNQNSHLTTFCCFKKWQRKENKKPSSQRRDAAFFILTETGLADELSEDFPHGNLILRED